jgi:hypothetical protein
MRAAGMSFRKIGLALGVPAPTIRLALKAALFAIGFYVMRLAIRVTA